MDSPLVAPTCYVDWINQNLGFNPRSQKASDYLSECILKDLLSISPFLKQQFDNHRIQSALNEDVSTRNHSRDVDLVVFDPTIAGQLNRAQMTIENKTIMTAHGKARKNRQGDLVASANHVHNHNRFAIAGATMIINVSSEYENPDKIPTKTPRRHLSNDYITQTMELFQFILRESPDEPNDQPEAVAIILVDYDGVHEARFVTEPPALPENSPYHYSNFCRRMVRLYEERFSPKTTSAPNGS
jgi:hypothetical protein